MAELTLTADTQVSAIAAAYPATLRMMEALGIDYCCGGKLPLREAAAKVKAPLETVLAVLQAAIMQAAAEKTTERDWQQAPLDELQAHIIATHHAYLWKELPRLEGLLALVARVHGPNHSDVLQPLLETYTALADELSAHLQKEEQIIWPAITRALAGDRSAEVATAIADLNAEHDAAGALLAKMREVTHNYELPADACNTFRAVYDGLQQLEQDIHRHIHKENNILFPRVLKQVGDR